MSLGKAQQGAVVCHRCGEQASSGSLALHRCRCRMCGNRIGGANPAILACEECRKACKATPPSRQVVPHNRRNQPKADPYTLLTPTDVIPTERPIPCSDSPGHARKE